MLNIEWNTTMQLNNLMSFVTQFKIFEHHLLHKIT